MAPRANWKGFLRLSLVTCPVALYPATSESEKVSFNQLNRKTGHRIKYAKVDADTGEEVANEDIVKGYKVDTDTFIEVTKEELENVAQESTRTIEIDEFVDRSEIDPRYLIRPYYLVPDGKVGHDAFAVVRETIREMNKVAIGRVVLTNREHIIALEPMDKGGPSLIRLQHAPNEFSVRRRLERGLEGLLLRRRRRIRPTPWAARAHPSDGQLVREDLARDLRHVEAAIAHRRAQARRGEGAIRPEQGGGFGQAHQFVVPPLVRIGPRAHPLRPERILGFFECRPIARRSGWFLRTHGCSIPNRGHFARFRCLCDLSHETPSAIRTVEVG
jgi:hypothetical protein